MCACIPACAGAHKRYNMRVVECRLAAGVLAHALGKDKVDWERIWYFPDPLEWLLPLLLREGVAPGA